MIRARHATPAASADRQPVTSFVGMAVFLGGWSMTFAALLFVWSDVRLTAGAWPPDGEARAPLMFPSLATLLIVMSSWALVRRSTKATIALGLAFLAVQLAGWTALWRSGLAPSSGRYGSLVFGFGAFHALHVAVGLGGLILARASRANWKLFWHFVGAVWLVLFAVLYLAGCDERPFTRPLVLGGRSVDAATLNRGRDVYQQYCRACHGEHGDGRGYSSLGLRPPPRDFTQGLFKFGHTPIPGLPPDAELGRTVRLGLNGTAMLPWDVSDPELDAVLQYIKTFSPRWRSEPPGPPIVPTPDPFGVARAAEAVALGDKVFRERAQCTRCHGTEARELKETEYCLAWKPGWRTLDERECALPVRELPPDLHCDPLRAVYRGSELVDLYRTIAAGIGGANMPTWRGTLTEDELWSLAYYVRSLRPPNDRHDGRRDGPSDRQTGCKWSRTGQ